MASSTLTKPQIVAQAATTQSRVLPGRACEACNRKKTKCDMRRPSCGLCLRTGTSCRFPSTRKKPLRTNAHPMKSQACRPSNTLSNLLELIDSEPCVSEAIDNLLRQEIPRTPLRDPLEETSLQDDQQSQHHRKSSCSSSIEQVTNRSQLEQSSEPAFEDETCSDTASIHSLSNRVKSQTAHQPSSENSRSIQPPVSASLALDLIRLFFVKIQPWLPLFHRPRFETRYQNLFSQSSLQLSTLKTDERFLLYSLFSLSARYSVHPDLQSINGSRRGDEFAEYAKQLYQGLREEPEPSFTWAQGCVLLAFHIYTSGPTHQGWMLIGVCSRLVYEFGLSNLDSADWEPINSVEHIDKEELRRVWWSVYELDMFASSISLQPYSIDRKQMAVNLPITDDIWFTSAAAVSSPLVEDAGQSWESLRNSNNQDARAWFLASNSFMARLVDNLQQKEPMSSEEVLLLSNELFSFKMSLPKLLRLEHEQPLQCLSNSTANWIIGIHLMLLTCSYMMNSVTPVASEAGPKFSRLRTPPQPVYERAIELSHLLRLWEPELIATSHPFFACMLVRACFNQQDSCHNSPIVRSCSDLVKLILALYAKKWRLGSILLKFAEGVEQGISLSEKDRHTIKQFSIFSSRQSPVDSPHSIASKTMQTEVSNVLVDTNRFETVDSQLTHLPLPNIWDTMQTQMQMMSPAQISMYPELSIQVPDNGHMTNDLEYSPFFIGCSTPIDTSLRNQLIEASCLPVTDSTFST
ncbi:hypothetical protein BU24DRAFT_424906 [Aaosphaeria arxii CBS 175.79]|uniref:Zn(2)-C6 fungal-type domain-containing protein n=1 Tax=Aaosphaeria arxii CBS 175.79 TaxID=1450172 RepID=A0A6A5XM36_9PLEO|nr:uncharacterized protein BU24DRAFT_424906 [Aaosphaeria arxii CBS 175.79]KAF2013871.1 hypothetical protein BU24DRAFT_424906 [Aaosphaeria arxii CBS 175.79]